METLIIYFTSKIITFVYNEVDLNLINYEKIFISQYCIINILMH